MAFVTSGGREQKNTRCLWGHCIKSPKGCYHGLLADPEEKKVRLGDGMELDNGRKNMLAPSNELSAPDESPDRLFLARGGGGGKLTGAWRFGGILSPGEVRELGA